MPASEFRELLPGDFAALWKAWQQRVQREDYRAGLVACIMANAHRDPKLTRPFGPEDFFPSLEHLRPAAPTADDLWGKMEASLQVKES